MTKKIMALQRCEPTSGRFADGGGDKQVKIWCVACSPHIMKTSNLYPIQVNLRPSFRFYGIPKNPQRYRSI